MAQSHARTGQEARGGEQALLRVATALTAPKEVGVTARIRLSGRVTGDLRGPEGTWRTEPVWLFPARPWASCPLTPCVVRAAWPWEGE